MLMAFRTTSLIDNKLMCFMFSDFKGIMLFYQKLSTTNTRNEILDKGKQCRTWNGTR